MLSNRAPRPLMTSIWKLRAHRYVPSNFTSILEFPLAWIAFLSHTLQVLSSIPPEKRKSGTRDGNAVGVERLGLFVLMTYKLSVDVTTFFAKSMYTSGTKR